MTTSYRLTVGKNGRLVIPAVFRRAMGLSDGGEVLLRLHDGCVEIEPPDLALRRAREAVARYAKGRQLGEELLQERKDESDDG